MLLDMDNICRLAKQFCENASRTIPIDKDVELALAYLNVPEEKIIQEIEKLKNQPQHFPALEGKTLIVEN